MILAALAAGEPVIAALIVISSLLAVIYIWRVVEAAYFREPPPGAPAGEAPLTLLAPTWVLITLNVYFGIETSLPVGVAGHAARSLMGAGP